MPAALPDLAFIGGGAMAQAMISALLQLPERPRITVSDPDPGKRAAFVAQGIAATDDNRAAAQAATLVVLAVKPQHAATVLPPLASGWRGHQILVSILAGTPTRRLAALLGSEARIVRAMPNTPLAIGMGMVGVCAGATAKAGDLELVRTLFAPCAKVLQVDDEERMDAVTAVSGSGPAYFFAFAEALVAGAQALGFTADEATLLVAQTGAGAWEYLLRSGFAAERLRQQVTSPGGTTAAALQVLAASDFPGTVRRALAAARQRGAELAMLA